MILHPMLQKDYSATSTLQLIVDYFLHAKILLFQVTPLKTLASHPNSIVLAAVIKNTQAVN